MADLRYIRVERDAEIAVVFVDRQDKLNTLNAEVVAELLARGADIEARDEV